MIYRPAELELEPFIFFLQLVEQFVPNARRSQPAVLLFELIAALDGHFQIGLVLLVEIHELLLQRRDPPLQFLHHSANAPNTGNNLSQES